MQHKTTSARAQAARDACPHITPQQAQTLASRGADDALDLITDIHDIDPQEIWGRLVLWGRHDPPRLVAAVVALAAMHNPHTPQQVLNANVHAVASDERHTAA